MIVLASARPRRPPCEEDEEERWRPRLPWWAKAAAVLLALAALVAPFAVLFTRKPRSLRSPVLPGGPPRASLGRPPAPAAGSTWPLIVGMVIAILIVLVLTFLSRRRRRAQSATSRRNPLAALLDTLAAGRDALAAGDDPRAAIIACYAAMERGFAAAGSVPAAADTPAEVLARATRAGLVRPGPAETLAGLFRRARYSSHPMTSVESQVAADALTAMHADLAEAVAGP